MASVSTQLPDAVVPDERPADPHQKAGEDVAYGAAQTLLCLATDGITDPLISDKIQKKFFEDEHHHGSLGHNYAGEIAGDLAAFFVFIGLQRFIPQITGGLKRAAAFVLNPLYEVLGKKDLRSWARVQKLDETAPEYRQKLAEWKDSQADNLARSSLITSLSVAFNVIVQRRLPDNTHKWSSLIISKVVANSVTLLLVVGGRLLLPETSRRFDEEASRRFFSPLIHTVRNWFGGSKSAESSLPADSPKADASFFADAREPKADHAARFRDAKEAGAGLNAAAR